MARTPDEKNGRLSLDQLLDQIDQTARDPDAGPDRFRAAKLLLSLQSASVGLPEPLTDPEMIEQLKRVMKPAGRTNCQIAFKQAFMVTKTSIEDDPDVQEQHLSVEERQFARSITSVKKMNREFTELWKVGIHAGQPRGRGEAALRAWLYKTVCDAIKERKKNSPELLAAQLAKFAARARHLKGMDAPQVSTP